MDTRSGQGRRQRRPSRAKGPLALACAALVAAAGCGTPTAPPRYMARHGVITEIDVETGEITVEVRPQPVERAATETVHWLVNKHSEIYDTGRLVEIDALKKGDEVEFIGYPDPNSRPVRFVVTLARLVRDAKEFKTPELPATGG